MFQRILVANRGEIALRIIRACKELDIETVCVYSTADAGSQYLQLADEAICVGPPRGAQSYLKIDQIISAAEVGNVEAIHPGYGFLSENAHFNEVCRSCKIDFIGPTPQAMEALGDKNTARGMAKKANVPVVPGSAGLITAEQAAYSMHKNLVTRAVGVDELVDLEIHDYPVEPGDLLLMCSDGLSDMLSDEQIEQLLRTNDSLPAAGTMLVQAANAAGGRDNIAVVLARAKPGNQGFGKSWWSFWR